MDELPIAITSNPKSEDTSSTTNAREVEMKKLHEELDRLKASLKEKDALLAENKSSSQATTNRRVSFETETTDLIDSRNDLENNVEALLKQKESLQNEIKKISIKKKDLSSSLARISSKRCHKV